MDEDRKKILANSILKFLTDMCGQVNEEKKESLEVAIQCIENAFEITPTFRNSTESVNLLETITVESSPINSELAEEHKNTGNIAMRNSDYDQAIKSYSLAIVNNPRNAIYYCNRAAAYTRLEQNRDAVNDCKKALKLDPSYGKAYGRMGIAYSNMGMYEEARDAYQAALTYDPNNEMYKQNLLTAQEHLAQPRAPPTDPRKLLDFLNNESFVEMASQMMNTPEFNNMMSGLANMPGSSTNFDVLLEAGSNLASQLQQSNPNLADTLRSRFTVTNRQGTAPPDPSAFGDTNEGMAQGDSPLNRTLNPPDDDSNSDDPNDPNNRNN